MKSIFTKLSTLLLCGAVAMVSCTDFSEDIQNLDNKVDNLGNTTQTELATLQKAITDLEAKLAAQYATKDEVAALKTALENSIASEVDALSKDIADVNAALKAAEDKINGAIADLDDKKADKTAVDAAIKTATEAIAALQSQLEAAKGELEAEIDEVKAEIAATEEELAAQIGAVDAKANELHNTLLALSDYLANLEAKVNELKGTLDALSEYLPKMKAELEEKINDVDAKAIENFNTLLALSDHLAEYEATTDFKLVELQGSLAALSVYLEEYEASVDAKFKEILNTFDSLDGFLDEKFAALEATDTDLYKEIEGIRVVLTALNNLLTDEAAARMTEDNALYELIGTSVTALNNLIADLEAEDQAIYAEIDGVRQAFTTLNNLLADEVADRTAEDAAIYELIGTSVTALNNLIADLAAEDDAIYVEMENIRTYIAQVYNSLSYEIQAVDAALQAHIAAFEAFKEAYEAKVDELEATDENLYVEINGLREVITTINNHIDDLRAEDEAIYAEINGVRENLTQLQNAINNRIDEEVAALEDKILESVQDLESMIRDTQEGLSAALRLIADNSALIAANAAAIDKLETAVEILNLWAEAHQDEYDDLVQLVTKHVADLTAQIEALNEKDLELEANIGETSKALSALIEDTEKRFGEIEVYIKENFDLQGTAIKNLENILNDLRAELGARLDALENRVSKIEIDVDALKAALEALDTALAEAEKRLDGKDKALEEMIHNIDKAIKDLKDDMWANRNDIAKNSEQIAAIITSISKIQSELKDNAEWQESMTTVTTQLNNAIANLWEAIDLLGTTLQKNIDDAVAKLTAEDAKIRAEIEAGLAEMLRLAILNDEGVMDNVRQFEIKMSGIVEELRAAIKNLADRVQSLVYVPDYNDHKATIEWATISAAGRLNNTFAVPTYVVKTSDLKYLVKAEKAAEVATAIAANWSKVLDYNVKAVKTRAADEADLEIVNVVAQGEYIVVSVLAKNFATEFFDNEKSYSAALVLADDNNTRSTEYTNLIAGTPVKFQMNLFLETEETELDGNTIEVVENGSVITYKMACNDTELVKSAVKPLVGFVPVVDGEAVLTAPLSFYTPEYLASEGYDIDVDMAITIVNCEKDVEHDGTMDVKPDYVKIDPYFNIEAGNPVYDFHYTVKEGVSFDNVGKSSTVEYVFTCGNVSSSLTYEFELDNAQIVVNVGDYNETTGEYSVEVPWTVKLRDELTVEGKQYAADLNVASTWTGYDDIKSLMNVNNSLLSGRKYTYFVKDNNGKWVETSNVKFDLGGWPTEANPTLKWGFKGETYAWNNEYKVVYTAVNETEHIDITVNFILKLTHKPVAPFAVNIPVTFELAPSGAFQASVDVLAEMYKAVAEGEYDYLGFGKDNANVWAAYTSGVPATYMDGYMGAPVVNENKGAAGYVSNIWNLTLAQVAQNQYVDGKNVITWDANGIIDFDFDVTISGEANIPAYDLIYSTDYATEANPRVHVNGKKDQSGKYVIDQADLAKYFNVTRLDLAGGKKGIAEGHSLTVDFTVTDPEIAAKLNAPAFATVVEDNKGTYLTLKSDVAVLQWNEFTGLEIPVTASLKVNGFELETLDLVLWTEDPLTLKNVAPVSEKRAPGKTPTVAKIYKNLSLTGILEPEKNLIDASVKVQSAWSETYTQATELYGANMTISFAMAEEGVYYEENGKKIYLDKNKFDLDPVMGTITLYGDDADLNVTYIAKCYVQLTHRFCEDAHAKAQLVTVKFVPNK